MSKILVLAPKHNEAAGLQPFLQANEYESWEYGPKVLVGWATGERVDAAIARDINYNALSERAADLFDILVVFDSFGCYSRQEPDSVADFINDDREDFALLSLTCYSKMP